jgi:thiopurine S-methyltransferase
LGVELSQLAVEQFFDGNSLPCSRRTSAQGVHYESGDIEIICGDIFDLDAATLASCTGAFDRAALIALPPPMRPRYVQHVYTQLPAGCRGLLVTLDYQQDQMAGPPFSVGDDEVHSLYTPHTQATLLARHDSLAKEPKFAQRGVQRLDTLVYALQRMA